VQILPHFVLKPYVCRCRYPTSVSFFFVGLLDACWGESEKNPTFLCIGIKKNPTKKCRVYLLWHHDCPWRPRHHRWPPPPCPPPPHAGSKTGRLPALLPPPPLPPLPLTPMPLATLLVQRVGKSAPSTARLCHCVGPPPPPLPPPPLLLPPPIAKCSLHATSSASRDVRAFCGRWTGGWTRGEGVSREWRRCQRQGGRRYCTIRVKRVQPPPALTSS
jgi:hypothetical protein